MTQIIMIFKSKFLISLMVAKRPLRYSQMVTPPSPCPQPPVPPERSLEFVLFAIDPPLPFPRAAMILSDIKNRKEKKNRNQEKERSQKTFTFVCSAISVTYTAVIKKVVGKKRKSARDHLKRYCGWFSDHGSLSQDFREI